MSARLHSLDEEIAELKANFATRLAELEDRRPQIIADAIAEQEAKVAAANAAISALRAALPPPAVPVRELPAEVLFPPIVLEEPKLKEKRYASMGTLAWAAFVRHIKNTMPERFAGIKKQSDMLLIVKGIRAANMYAYDAFVEEFKAAHPLQKAGAV